MRALALATLLVADWTVVGATAFASDATVRGALAALVLAPVALWTAYALGAGIAGPRFGVGSAALLVFLPVAGLRFFTPSYRDTYVDHGLATALGLRDTRLLLLALLVGLVLARLPGRAAAAAGVAVLLGAAAVWGVDRAGFSDVRLGLHENAWSVAFAEWLPVAGCAGLVRRSWLRAAGLAGWVGAVLLHAVHESFDTGAFWRALVPALPAIAVAAAGIGLLIPRFREPAQQARASAS